MVFSEISVLNHSKIVRKLEMMLRNKACLEARENIILTNTNPN